MGARAGLRADSPGSLGGLAAVAAASRDAQERGGRIAARRRANGADAGAKDPAQRQPGDGSQSYEGHERFGAPDDCAGGACSRRCVPSRWQPPRQLDHWGHRCITRLLLESSRCSGCRGEPCVVDAPWLPLAMELPAGLGITRRSRHAERGRHRTSPARRATSARPGPALQIIARRGVALCAGRQGAFLAENELQETRLWVAAGSPTASPCT